MHTKYPPAPIVDQFATPATTQMLSAQYHRPKWIVDRNGVLPIECINLAKKKKNEHKHIVHNLHYRMNVVW